MKLKIFKQLNSANVFRYLEKYKILNYLKRTRFEFVNKNIPFVPSFTKLYSRIDDLKNSLGIYWKTPKTNDDNKTKEIIDAQIYLLKNIYYGEFLNYFMSNNGNFFEISREIIELNKNDKRNLKMTEKLLKELEMLEKMPYPQFIELIDGEVVFS